MGTPLDSLKIPESNWEYSDVLRDALTALAWGFTDIEDFWAMSPLKRALYIETFVVKSQMQSYEDKVSSEKVKQQGNPKT